MAKTSTIEKVLIIGAGHNDIGREGQHDSAMAQAGASLKRLGLTVILVDNNPYSVAAENGYADKVYLEPLTVAAVTKIIEQEQPDALIPALGGIVALQLVASLIRTNVLKNQHVELLGFGPATVEMLMNPALLNNQIKNSGQPVIISQVVASTAEALQVVRQVNYPVIVKPVAPRIEASRTICADEPELQRALEAGFQISSTKQCTVEQSIVGYKEVEFVGIRDKKGTALLIGGLENFDPVGIHSGDSIVFAPTQTVTDQEYQQLRRATLQIMRDLAVVGPCHIQFALDPTSQKYYVIKVTPYFDRAMALVARSTGYPLMVVAGQVMAGVSLAEVKLAKCYRKQTALIEPVMDHIVCRVPVWPFNVLKKVSHQLDTVQESTGSVIGIGRSTEEALLKGLRATDESRYHVIVNQSQNLSEGDLIQQLIHPRAGRMLILLEALRRGYQIDELAELTKIDAFYFYKLSHILEIEKMLVEKPFDVHALGRAKYFGFTDEDAAVAWHAELATVRKFATSNQIQPTYKEVEPTAGEFDEQTLTYYSTYEYDNESAAQTGKRVVIIGTGASRLGTNHGNDYLVSQLVFYLKKADFVSIPVNANPNSVSLNVGLAAKRYLEPKQLSDILNILQIEQPELIITTKHDEQLGAQLKALGWPVWQIEHDVPANQPKTNDQPAIELVSDGESVQLFGVSELIAGNNLRTNVLGSLTVFPVESSAETSAVTRLWPMIQNYVKEQHLVGLFTVGLQLIDGQLQLHEWQPMSIAKIALISKSYGASLTRLLLRLHLGDTLDKILHGFPHNVLDDDVFVQANTFPYTQLQVHDPAELTGSPAHATGAVIAHAATLKSTLVKLEAGNESTDF